MKLGMKVGPDALSIQNVREANPAFVEVWFRIDKQESYDGLFAFLTQHKTEVGLHFWGLTTSGFVPTLVHSDTDLRHESMDLVKRTIDVASRMNAAYVNIHPGFQRRVHCDYQNLKFSTTDDIVEPFERATDIFLDCAGILTDYADRKNILLTIETTPLFIQAGSGYGTAPRLETQDLSEYSYLTVPTDRLSFAIANDFGHTAANYIGTDNRLAW